MKNVDDPAPRRAARDIEDGKSKKKEIEVRGNTLRVYLHLLKNGPSELRDVQRALGLSTPSLAAYHLGRLTDAGYAWQDEHGSYVALADRAGELVAGYKKVGFVVVPQTLFFAVLFSILTGFFSFELLTSPGSSPYFLVATSIAATATLWFEAIRLWRKLGS